MKSPLLWERWLFTLLLCSAIGTLAPTRCAAAVFGLDTLPPRTSLYRDTFCGDQLIFLFNNIYTASNPRGRAVLPGKAAGGRDSFIQVELTFLKIPVFNYEPTICESDTVWVNKTPYHAKNLFGKEILEGRAANGCDSIVNVKVRFRADPFSYLRDTLCPEDFRLLNKKRYDKNNPSGLEVLKNASWQGCDSLVYVELSFRQAWLWLGEARSIIQGDTVCIAPFSLNPLKRLQWTPAPPCRDSTCLNFCAQPLQPVEYKLKASDRYDCPLNASLKIGVTRQHEVFAPNIFRPGSVAPNDRFFVSADVGVVRIRHLHIRDRWGELLYQAKDLPNSSYEDGWDGTSRGQVVDNGVYFWQAELESLTGKIFIWSGTVAVAR